MNKLYREFSEVKDQHRWLFVGSVLALAAFELYNKYAFSLLYSQLLGKVPESQFKVVVMMIFLGLPYIVLAVMCVYKNIGLKEICLKLMHSEKNVMAEETERVYSVLNIFLILSVVFFVIFILTIYFNSASVFSMYTGA